MTASGRVHLFSVIIIVLGATGLLFQPLSALYDRPPGLNSAIANPSVSQVHRTFWLLGSASSNWNGTVGNPSPIITVFDGDLVTIMFNSVDTLPHTWFVDTNNNFRPDPGEIFSVSQATSTTFVNFTFTPKIGTSAIPTAGDYTYRCSIHPTMMFGIFRVNAVPLPDFSISSSPNALGPITVGSSATSAITVASQNGFNGIINLSKSVSPATGLKVSLALTSLKLVSGGTNSTTLNASGTAPGTYTITVTGINGTLSHSTPLTVSVATPDFTISSNPASMTIAQGSSGTATITVTSLNSFSGTVNLAPAVSPSGPQVSVSPTSVTLSSGGSSTATLTVSATSSGLYSPPVSQGSYTVTVTGTGSSLSHSTSVSVTVGSTSSPPSGVGSLPTSLIIGVIVAAVAVVALAIYIIRRKPRT